MVFTIGNLPGLNPTNKQFCRVNGVDLEIGDLQTGVPQGSCPGTLLFLIYSLSQKIVQRLIKC